MLRDSICCIEIFDLASAQPVDAMNLIIMINQARCRPDQPTKARQCVARKVAFCRDLHEGRVWCVCVTLDLMRASSIPFHSIHSSSTKEHFIGL